MSPPSIFRPKQELSFLSLCVNKTVIWSIHNCFLFMQSTAAKLKHLCLRREIYCSLKASLPSTCPEVVIFHLKLWGKVC